MRHRLIPAALATGASLVLLAGTAMAATPTWTVVPSVNPSATTLNAVCARTATDAWAVGQGKDARPLAEHWDGTAWSVVPVPVPAVPSGTSFANAALSSMPQTEPLLWCGVRR